MKWRLNPAVNLRNDRVPNEDADRQIRTAAEILRRFDGQPGVILADEVGMGKTYVALAAAFSVLEATGREQPVIVMAPSSVADKWRTEWDVFSQRCLPLENGLRVAGPIRRGSELLKLLDDPPDRRHHLIVVTHGALTSSLSDPFVRLALLRQATLYRSDLQQRRRALARYAHRLLSDRRFADSELVEVLLDAPPSRWRKVWDAHRPDDLLADDPVPDALLLALKQVDLSPLREAIMTVPVNHSANIDTRLQDARQRLDTALNETWTASLHAVDLHLPLVVLDEAHHVRNPTQLAKLFANEDAERDAEALQGPLGNIFDRMLFLTATPFQLNHQELLRVLDRFHGIRWASSTVRAHFSEQLQDLGPALDRARASALRLERAWSRIDAADAAAVAAIASLSPHDSQPPALRDALAIASEARADLKHAEALLRPWVIRHQRSGNDERRRHLAGCGILDNQQTTAGLSIDGPSTLPFLLASRAQAVASLDGADGQRSTRALFAYGLASSFEAYADTRRNREVDRKVSGDGAAILDDLDVENDSPCGASPRLAWYLDRINAALPPDTADGWAAHPKINATVRRVLDLWRSGEKTLTFCFYVETGRALRSHISRALRDEIVTRAAESLDLETDEHATVLAEVNRIGERLLRSDSHGYQAFRERVRTHLTGLDHETAERVAEITVRFMRTPSYLVRLPGLRPGISVDDLVAGLDHTDASGTTLAAHLEAFARTVARQVSTEKDEILQALDSIQTGDIAAAVDHFDPSERCRDREMLLPNVRLANGGVRRDTRRRLMLTFNTPFFPEVLVASSVMSEGVDLHQDCRHIVHHDLDWNPSTLEQRTGRIDRIRSKAERTGQPIVVYEPYLAGTHDEKMFRVVKDRERWFGVVMGETPDLSEGATERQATQVPLPKPLAAELTLDLSVAYPEAPHYTPL